MEEQNQLLIKIVDEITTSVTEIGKISVATEENHKQIEEINNALNILTTTAVEVKQVSTTVADSANGLFDKIDE